MIYDFNVDVYVDRIKNAHAQGNMKLITDIIEEAVKATNDFVLGENGIAKLDKLMQVVTQLRGIPVENIEQPLSIA
jgi:beta-glucosidase-like glycosyl hydrolase